MNKQQTIIVGFTLANSSTISKENLIEYIKGKAPEYLIYYLNPQYDGVYSAAHDWKIIGNISSIMGIISFLWLIYSDLILPKKEQDSDASIHINIENIGNNNQIWIGNQINSKEEFINEMRIIMFQDSINPDKTIEILDTLKHPGNWKQLE